MVPLQEGVLSSNLRKFRRQRRRPESPRRQRDGAGAHHIDIARGLAACALEWALRVPRQRAADRSGRHRPGVESIANTAAATSGRVFTAMVA